MAENETRTRRKQIDDKDLSRVMTRIARNVAHLRKSKKNESAGVGNLRWDRDDNPF